MRFDSAYICTMTLQNDLLLRTARGLDAHGIHDPYIWRLQELVVAEIERWPA